MPVLGDYLRVRQLVLILLDNAIKFSPENTELTVTGDGGEWLITVSDQGTGIDEDDLPYIFERFYKASDTVNPHGTGLGLCIAKQITLRHQAEITANNLLDKGCMFAVRFKRS